MHPFYDRKRHEPGSLVTVKEGDFPPTPDNPDGKSITAWNEDMQKVGTIPAGTSLLIFERPEAYSRGDDRSSMFVEVLSPELGRVWVRACDLLSVT